MCAPSMTLNVVSFNAAIPACEKGGLWRQAPSPFRDMGAIGEAQLDHKQLDYRQTWSRSHTLFLNYLLLTHVYMTVCVCMRVFACLF